MRPTFSIAAGAWLSLVVLSLTLAPSVSAAADNAAPPMRLNTFRQQADTFRQTADKDRAQADRERAKPADQERLKADGERNKADGWRQLVG